MYVSIKEYSSGAHNGHRPQTSRNTQQAPKKKGGQKKTSIHILNLIKEQHLNQKVSLPTLERQRRGGDLTEAYKYIHGIYQIKSPLFTVATYSETRDKWQKDLEDFRQDKNKIILLHRDSCGRLEQPL